jgi:hypothetical protein
MSTEDIAGEPFSSLSDVEPTTPIDDTTYWVGAMSDQDLLRLGSGNMNQPS